MSIATPTGAPGLAPGLIDRVYRFTVDQYWAISEAGVFGEDDRRLELLEGLIVTKMTKNGPHINGVKLTNEALRAVLPAGWHVGQESPMLIRPRSEPEPDLSIVRGEIRDYPDGKPLPADVALLVEVSDTSYEFDTGTKLGIYARASISAYWVLDVVDRILEVHTDPTGPAEPAAYRQVRRLCAEDHVGLVLDGREVARIAVNDLLP